MVLLEEIARAGSSIRESNKKARRQTMFCNYCGTMLPDDALFCNKCGKQQKAVTNTSVPDVTILPGPAFPAAPIDAGQPPTGNAPMVQGTPQASGVPSAQGTPSMLSSPPT